MRMCYAHKILNVGSAFRKLNIIKSHEIESNETCDKLTHQFIKSLRIRKYVK